MELCNKLTNKNAQCPQRSEKKKILKCLNKNNYDKRKRGIKIRVSILDGIKWHILFI